MLTRTSILWQAHGRIRENTSTHTHACSCIKTLASMRAVAHLQTRTHLQATLLCSLLQSAQSSLLRLSMSLIRECGLVYSVCVFLERKLD